MHQSSPSWLQTDCSLRDVGKALWFFGSLRTNDVPVAYKWIMMFLAIDVDDYV